MSWRYARWPVDHPLPLGASERVHVGDVVVPGDTIATGIRVSLARRVRGARALGVDAKDLSQVMRVRVGQDIARGAVLARTGRRFARAVVAPIDGRLIHVSAEGDFYVAPAVERWIVRSTMAGEVTRSTDSGVTVEGAAWSLGGIAAYGPDAIGELVMGVRDPHEELLPRRIDVRLRDRILMGGARMAAEAVTRSHACGIAGMVVGAVPAGGLRVVYGDDVAAAGGATNEDRPTVLCLVGFGNGPLPHVVFEPFEKLAGSLCAIHVASARLFVFAPAEAGDFVHEPPALMLAGDYGSVRPLEADDTTGDSNVLAFDAPR